MRTARSAAKLSRFPIVVIATIRFRRAADWRAQTKFLVTTAVLSASVIALILFLIIRQIRRQSRDAQQRLEAERQPADTALNNMIQGLVMYDASARIVNRQPALHRYVQPVAGSREAGLSFSTIWYSIARIPGPSTATSMNSVRGF